MVFNKNIDGYTNEEEFVKMLNDKKVENLNPLFQEFIKDLYKAYVIHDNDITKCYKNEKREKADFIIEINNIQKRISLKKGVKNSVHVEPVWTFTKFLKNNKVPDNIIKLYLKFHYADGTIDGSGKQRMDSEEYKKRFQVEIDLINKFFNNPILLKKCCQRFVLGLPKSKEIDAIVFGVIDDFIWMNKNEIINSVLRKRNNNFTGIHFGPLFCQPQNRCINKNPKYEFARNYTQIKWYHLSDDIIEELNNRYL